MSGCVPNVTTYYRPAVEGGRLSAGRCVPTESIVTFGALPIEARVVEGRDNWYLMLDIDPQGAAVPRWQSFRFGTGDFRIRDLDTGVIVKGLSVAVRRDDETASVLERYRRPASGRIAYAVEIGVPGTPPRRFELLLPTAEIDGVETVFPPVRFERRTWVGISPFNC